MLTTALALCGSGCAGSGAGLDSNGRPVGSGGSDAGPTTPDFRSLQDTVFTPICSVCHAGGSAPQGLRLDDTNSYSLLVDVPSTEVPAILRVKPGDPDNSYLVQKIEGHAAIGAQMPLGEPPLTADTVSAIRQWVTDGAPAPHVLAQPAVLRMTTMAPAPGDIVGSPPHVVIAFSEELDATRIDADSVRLERFTDESPNDVMQAIATDWTLLGRTPHALLLVPHPALAPGHYRIVARAGAGIEIADIGGHVLHGDARTGAGDWLLGTFDVVQEP